MFDIKIGTVVRADEAAPMIKQLNPKGFESYALDFNCVAQDILPKIEEHAKWVTDALEGQTISCIGYYGNPILDREFRERLKGLIKNAHLYGCNTVGTFAGFEPDKTVPETIPGFKAAFTELCEVAEAYGVRIGIEGCGRGWDRNSGNIGYCSHSWELLFDAVDSPALGLEWEPAHAVCQLVDPIPQLRKWAKKVVHLHGKDGTVAWDVIRSQGLYGGYPYAWDRTPGFGDTNWADIFTILIMNGFEGSCDIEGFHDPVHYDDMEWTAQVTSLDYLKRCRGGVSYFRGPDEYRGFQGERKPGRA